MSEHRPYIDKVHAGVYSAMREAVREERRAYRDAGLGADLIELINVRVSQLNGCLTCLSVHMPAARRAGVAQAKLDLLPAWREAESYTPADKAALELAESLTMIDKHTDREALGLRVAEHFNEEQISALEWAIILINSFNRISIASGHPALPPRD